MKRLLIFFFIIIISLAIRLIIINNHLITPNFPIEQDGYANYAIALRDGTLNTDKKFSLVETRLLPGYPLMIYTTKLIFGSETNGGLAISLISSIISIFLFWNISKSLPATGLFALFPPVWVIQSTKVSTEPVTVLLLLLSIILFKRKYFFLAGLSLGFAFDIRLISICLFLVLFILTIKNYHFKSSACLFSGFIVMVISLFFYNYSLFGQSGLFKQFQVYYSINRVSIGFIQITQDIFRAFDWKQYRILLSGLFYLSINSLALFQLFKNRTKSFIYQIYFYWMLLSLIFIFLLGPTPMLEEFARFTVPFVPALILGIFPLIQNIQTKFLKRP